MRKALRRYSYINGRLVGIHDVQAGKSYVAHCDHQGTVQCLTDETGAVTDRFAADALGNPVKRTGASINKNWYIGGSGYYQASRLSSSYYVRARYLESSLARFLSVDPFQAAESLYAYARNSPAIRIDPTGGASLRIGDLIPTLHQLLFCQREFNPPPVINEPCIEVQYARAGDACKALGSGAGKAAARAAMGACWDSLLGHGSSRSQNIDRMIGCMLRWCAKKKIDTVGDGFGECKSGACGAAELGGGYRKPEGPYHPTTMNICQRSCANSGPCSGSGQNANTIFHELAHLCDINTKQHPNLPYRDRPEEIRAFCFGDALSEFYRSV